MPRYITTQVFIAGSVLYLVVISAVSGYAASRANNLAIPIPKALSGFTTALPAIAGILLKAGYEITKQSERQRELPPGATPRPPLVIIANTIIFIYSTVVITLLGTHAAPLAGEDCRLDQHWRQMFSHKDEDKIKAIQDALKCCGLMNSRDKAWPFPGKGIEPDACEKSFHRKNGCIGPWTAEEHRVAGILMAVVGLVFVWQSVIIIAPTQRNSWLHRVLPNRISRAVTDEEQGQSNGHRRAIDYLPNFNRYSDNVAHVDSDSEDENPGQRLIEEVDQPENRSHGNNQRQTSVENEWSQN